MSVRYRGAGVTVDADAFEPMRIAPVRHTLMGHPLLELPRLVELGRRLGATGSVRYHDDKAQAGTDFVKAADLHRVERPAEEVIADIENAGAWMALHHVQQDPEYRGLVDEVLDCVRPIVERKDGRMHHLGGWIFITSPGAVTPYHMDHEHNFILQVRGRKRIHVFDPLDRSIVSEEALEAFHHWGSRERMGWTEAIQAKAHIFDAEPGMGAYMPVTSPHWVENGPEVSITISCTYYSPETRRRKRLHQANAALRARGITPSPVGAHPTRDRLKDAAYHAFQEARARLKQARGQVVHSLDIPYAVPHTEIYRGTA
ncbi:MAG: cupin-like domain-containing protein [Deltaproteobacteria bacterium]|nr:cupin-like domain-containing protein [Deltaproteobacteria bacterium]